MKIFAVYGRLNLTKKPDWFDDVRAKFGTVFEFHVTLKQSCFIEGSQVPDIKSKLEKVFYDFDVPNRKIDLVFDELKAGKSDEPDTPDGCIMLNAAENQYIIELQRKIREILKNYDKYEKPEARGYEYDFHPHITVVDDLTKEKYDEAIKYFEADYRCEGVIEEIVLVVVQNPGHEEVGNPANQTVYKL
jgi:2'-5' RNA ligase